MPHPIHRRINRRRAALAAALLALGTVVPLALPTAIPAEAREPLRDIPDIVHPLLPGVVNLAVWGPPDASTPANAAGVKPDRVHFFGSGFVIDPSGIIVTNKHVIANAYQITAHFSDGSRARAHLLAQGGSVDLAILKVDVPTPLHALAWGNSDDLRIGDPVLTIGNPLGLGMSVSAGIVSALNRNINDSPYDDYIQTDAAINHGNSGGPLVDLEGEVVGVDTSLYTVPNGGSIGLGFAITSNDAKFVIDRLLQYGEVRAGWIGVALQEVSPDVVAALGLPWREGAIVARVDPGSAALRAGIQDGDIIRRMDGKPFRDSRALMRLIGKTPIGQVIQLAIWRDGTELTTPVTVEGYPDDSSPKGETKGPVNASSQRVDMADLGLTVLPITDDLRAKYKLGAKQTGVVISAVAPNSAAMEHGINPGDVVLRVQTLPVRTPADYTHDVQQARAAGRQYVLLLIRSANHQRWTGLIAGPPPTN